MTEAQTHTTTTKSVNPPRLRGNGERAKRVSKVKPGEAKPEKFARLAVERMTKARAIIRRICILGRDYPHTDAQRAKIVSEVHYMAGQVEAAFKPKGKRSDSFTF